MVPVVLEAGTVCVSKERAPDLRAAVDLGTRARQLRLEAGRDVKRSGQPELRDAVRDAAEPQTAPAVSVPELDWRALKPDWGRELGKGAQGSVYGGRYQQMDVAIKMFEGELTPTLREEILREARIHMVLQRSCPAYVVRLYGLTPGGSAPGMAMELAECTLKDKLNLISPWPGPVERLTHALPLLVQLAFALKYLHERGIGHGDVKPANVLLVRNAAGQLQVKLGDFGHARFSADEGDDDTLSPRGTLRYMARELFMTPPPRATAEALARVDVCALGRVINEAATGQVPWYELADDDTALLDALKLGEDPVPVVGAADFAVEFAELGSGLLEIMSESWESIAANRPTASEVATKLEELLEHLPHNPSNPSRPPSATRSRSPSMPPSAAGSLSRLSSADPPSSPASCMVAPLVGGEAQPASASPLVPLVGRDAQAASASPLVPLVARDAQAASAGPPDDEAMVQALAGCLVTLCSNLSLSRAREAARAAAQQGIMCAARLQQKWWEAAMPGGSYGQEAGIQWLAASLRLPMDDARDVGKGLAERRQEESMVQAVANFLKSACPDLSNDGARAAAASAAHLGVRTLGKLQRKWRTAADLGEGIPQLVRLLQVDEDDAAAISDHLEAMPPPRASPDRARY